MNEPNLYGNNLFGEIVLPPKRGLIADEFLIPPFSVLNAREGFWQERKQGWINMGIRGEVGREAASIHCKSDGIDGLDDDAKYVSIFDPVVCELAYRWFCPAGGQIIDPFAGGSVRGIVASVLGYNYWGCDLRKEQIEANNKQGENIIPENMPKWVCGDSMDEVKGAPDADFVFSCPPYGNLEKYSNDEKDLSNMEWHTFLAAYKRIILRTAGRMKQNTFACFVVGDFRDERGLYRNFVSETIAGFKECGLELYNEAILVTMVASLSMRIKKQFDVSRKMGKTHQNILVFVKGDPRKAAKQINDRVLSL